MFLYTIKSYMVTNGLGHFYNDLMPGREPLWNFSTVDAMTAPWESTIPIGIEQAFEPMGMYQPWKQVAVYYVILTGILVSTSSLTINISTSSLTYLYPLPP